MHLRSAVLALTILVVTVGLPAAHAQQGAATPPWDVPRFEVSLGYNHVDANAPPAGCECFGLNGGYVSADYFLKNWLAVTGEFTGGHADHISALGQNLTLMTAMGGPKVVLHKRRFAPYAEALFGMGRGTDSYFPTGSTFTTSSSKFGFSAGGGLDISLTHRFAIRAVDVQYLRTTFPNNVNNEQNHLMIGAGIVVKFGSRMSWTPRTVPPPRPSEISLVCGATISNLHEGEMLEVTGHATTLPDTVDIDFAWSTNGGRIDGSGHQISVDTAGMRPGDYRVTGTASLASSPSTHKECVVPFRIEAARSTNEQPTVTTNESAAEQKRDIEFHQNVADALFDYDSYAIRPDTQKAIEAAAVYLRAHPNIDVTIGGYSDERGSAEYNLALGEKRANAARQGLIDAGIAPERLKVISYGKEAQVCTANNEVCYQQNRRAAFAMMR